MKCLICMQSEIINGFTSVPFQRGEFRVIINNIPARICPSCSEAILDEDVAVRLLKIAEEVVDEGIFEDVRNYDR